MDNIAFLRTKALSFPEVLEQPHFEKTALSVKKKIFVTYDETKNLATLKLTESDQDIFCLASKTSIYPVPNKWGKKGWTIFELAGVSEDLLGGALLTAYKTTAPKKLGEMI